MNWIKWVKGLVRRREVIAASNKLSADRRLVACCFMLVMEWADENTNDGHVGGVSCSDIDAIADLPGFADAFESVGWIRPTTGGITFVNFERHNGETAKKRALDAARKQMSRTCPKNVRENSDTTGTREEKSREEKKGDKPPIPPAVSFPGFDAFWAAWPQHHRKDNKPKCLKSWVAKGLEPRAAQVLESLAAWNESASWAENRGQFIPAPLVWLNKGKYDSPRPPKAADAAAKPPFYESDVQRALRELEAKR